jgi:hypothetical protein
MKFTAIYPFVLLLTFTYAAPADNHHHDHDHDHHVCNTIQSCKKTGEQVWDRIQKPINRPELSKKYEESYVKYENTNVTGTDSGDGKKAKQLMSDLQVTLPDKLNQTRINSTTPGEFAYNQLFASGVIMSVRNAKEHDPITDSSKRLNWHAVAFEGYKRAGQKPEDLKYVLRLDIPNKETESVIEEVYKGAKKEDKVKQDTTEWKAWTYDANPDSFLGLLGTPMCNGAGWMLSDYAATLKKKIAKIHTRRLENSWSVAVEYTQ